MPTGLLPETLMWVLGLCAHFLNYALLHIIAEMGTQPRIWIKEERGFLISRYKLSPEPYLFMEYHYDIEPDHEVNLHLGTAKPVSLIEKCLILIEKKDLEGRALNASLTQYLDDLEVSNPLVAGVDTLYDKKMGAVRWFNKQAQLSEMPKICKKMGLQISDVETAAKILRSHEALKNLRGNELTQSQLSTITGYSDDLLHKSHSILSHSELRRLLDQYLLNQRKVEGQYHADKLVPEGEIESLPLNGIKDRREQNIRTTIVPHVCNNNFIESKSSINSLNLMRRQIDMKVI